MKRNDNEDLAFLRQKARESAPEAPESLSQENIEALVTGKKQKKHYRPVRAVVSVAVAVCVMLTSAVVLRDAVIAPSKVKRAVKNAGTPVSYAQVARRIEAQSRSSSIVFSFNSGVKYADADMVAAAEGSSAYNATGTAYGEKASYTTAYAETNVRTEGVLEADRVKTDGKYLYALVGRQLFIVNPAATLELLATLDLSDAMDWGGEFYLLENRLLALGQRYDYENEKEVAAALLYDISDPAAPVRLRALRFDGSLVSSRISENRLLLVTSFYPNVGAVNRNDPATFLPAYTDNDGAPCVPAEDSLYLGGGEQDAGFTTVSLIPLAQPDAEPRSITLFGSVADIYCTTDTLYAYSTVYPESGVFFDMADSSVTTCIQKLDVSGDVPVIAATGSVSGTVLNTFALDAYGGYLRVAAGDRAGNRVYVLDETLKQTGVSDVLAAGENIRSVRFMGNYAYVVTFLQTDPLFVLDLSDPTAPTLRGEVKLPGFSAYLHPAGEGYLIGIGYGGTETGLDGSAKISVFDVHDPEDPKETGSLTLNSASLNTDYKAFVTLPDGSFLLPYVKEEQVKNERPTEEETTAATADGYQDSMYWEEYIWTVTPGALRVTVENGQPALMQNYVGAPTQKDWPEARASFIGDSAFLLGMTYNKLRVERFYLADGTNTGSADFPVETETGGEIVYNGAQVID